ncbi:SSI family serine proteinase inhibitor [Arthrobacter sp. KK5.5]|uniref:SSI family serine proteinase inhibitor n=1 Tax=Arthrobacter sp. KK5.5 TaxID=3373084 RepID=UPI003EE580EF
MANGTDVDATHRVVCVDGAPAAGTDHPTPEDACAFLSGPDAGLLTALPRKDVACTQQYGGPQKARVHGVVDDSEVNKTFSLTDGCKIGEWDSARALLGMGSGAGT